MMATALWWLFFNLLSIVILAFYSMMEMACVSFNKVRLHYYVSNKNKRAIWLNYLLDHPFRLFGTTLIGVNVAMVAGSECAREFHSAIGLSPDLAPLTQVALVVIFGELAPMFAARHYAEHVAMLGVPFVYASAKILTPVLWIIGEITKAINFLIKGKTTHPEIFLTKEELEKILEEKGEPQGGDIQNFNVITRNIFNLQHKQAKEVMTSLDEIPRLPSNATIAQMKNIIKRTGADFCLIYYEQDRNIVGISFPRDLLRLPDGKRVRDYARPPWFVTQNTHLTQILQQFKKNNQSVAVILDKKGKASGILTLDDLLVEIFGEGEYKRTEEKNLFFMARTFPGDMKVGEFNRQFDLVLDKNEDLTLSQLLYKKMGRLPEKGESVYIEPFELTVKEISLLEVKSVSIKSLT